MAACTSWGSDTGRTRLRSVSTGDTLAPALPLRVFDVGESGVCDFYLTDLPEPLLRSGGDLTTINGVVVHVHLFTQPKAGKTPIAGSATTATIRVLILSGGQAGIYAGGSFGRVQGSPAKDATVAASLKGGTLYLVRATDAFADALGPCEFMGSFEASKNEDLAKPLARVLEALSHSMPSLEQPAAP